MGIVMRMTDVTFSPAPQQGESSPQNVTHAAPRRALTAAERKRRQREGLAWDDALAAILRGYG